MLALDPEQKLAGILAPVFALRGTNDLGIGDTEALKELITWAAQHEFRVVQILPVNETGADFSPYNLLSALALEPSTIATTPAALPDLDEKSFGEITKRHKLRSLKAGPVQYPVVKKLKEELLLVAFTNFRALRSDRKRRKDFRAFARAQCDWIDDYSLHRSLVNWNETEIVTNWPAEHKSPATARTWVATLDKDSAARLTEWKNFYTYIQWIAHSQWQDVRAHADRANVALLGDVPVGVSLYSSDVWSRPADFDVARSSGAPPEKVFKSDPFTENWGQNWGFPLYHWDHMASDNYAWWRRRLQLLMKIFHLIRVDHALGFFRIYSFPWRPEENSTFTDLTPAQAAQITSGPLPGFVEYDDSTESNREFNRKRGEAILSIFSAEVGPHCLIAEDLGEVAPYVRPVLEKLQIPGFKIPQWERRWDRLIPGLEYQRLSLATFATHDHPPIRTHWEALYAETQSEDEAIVNTAIHSMWEFMDFCGRPDMKLPQTYTPEIHAAFVRGLFASNSWLAIHMVPDLLGTQERFNVPGLAGVANWTERLSQPVAQWEQLWKSALETAISSIKETGRAVK